MGLFHRAVAPTSEEDRQLAFHLLLARKALERALEVCAARARRVQRRHTASRADAVTKLVLKVLAEVQGVGALSSSFDARGDIPDPLKDALFALGRARSACLMMGVHERRSKAQSHRRVEEVSSHLARLDSLVAEIESLVRGPEEGTGAHPLREAHNRTKPTKRSTPRFRQHKRRSPKPSVDPEKKARVDLGLDLPRNTLGFSPIDEDAE